MILIKDNFHYLKNGCVLLDLQERFQHFQYNIETIKNAGDLDETMTEKQRNEIKWFKKVDIERGGWRFLVFGGFFSVCIFLLIQ